jgi:hypothetical protein
LWDLVSGDLRSVPSRSFSHITVLGCTRAWQHGRLPADLPVSWKCRAAAPASPGQSSGSGRRSLHRRRRSPCHRAWGDPPSATSYGWEMQKSKMVSWYEESLRSSCVPTMVNVRGIPYVTLDRMTPTGKESDEQTRAYRRTPAVGDSDDTAATAGPPSRRAFSAVRAHGAELLAEGLFRTGLREPDYGGLRWKRLIGCSPSWRSGASSRSASNTAGWCTPFGSATLPHKAYGLSTG